MEGKRASRFQSMLVLGGMVEGKRASRFQSM